MSSVYATEPATSGRVIFETTYGPLELSLWSKECPTATKLFLQLCLDGFYENMLFHRIVPNFLIQTGALRQPGDPSVVNANADDDGMERYRKAVGAEEALERRKYEVHSRLRFNHRGQLAMALGVSDEDGTSDLQPQFFITLDEAPYLDGKHVIFGTVSGPTIFNALRIGSSEVDESSNQPVDMEHAPRIKSVKIVDNPLHKDLVPQNVVPWRVAKTVNDDKPKKKKKRKGKLDVNVLSFGDELEDGEAAMDTGIKSSHDVLDSKTLSKNVDEETAERARQSSSDDQKEPAVPKRKRPRVEEKHAEREQDSDSAAPIIYSKTKVKTSTAESAGAQAFIPEPSTEKPAASNEEKQSSKAISIVELRRSKYMNKGRASKKQREESTLAKLMAFQNKVKDQAGAGKRDSRKDGNENSLASRMARRAADAAEDANDRDVGGPAYHGQVLESDDEEQGASDWLGTRFKCRKHMDHHARGSGELGGDGRSMDDYLVLDPSQKEASDRGHTGSSDPKHHKTSHRDKKDGHRRHHKR
jgi:peptidyl-prolyl cis-trans isomerase SDCCAG10